jgi:hypothetical protein
MRTAFILSVLALSALKSEASFYRYDFTCEVVQMLNDSDSVKVDINAPVISFDNRLYQQGIQIGTFDKRSSIAKAQLTVRLQIYNLEGKAVAEAVAAGVNASYAITIFEGNQKLSMNLNFDHEAEELALKLRQMGKL